MSEDELKSLVGGSLLRKGVDYLKFGQYQFFMRRYMNRTPMRVCPKRMANKDQCWNPWAYCTINESEFYDIGQDATLNYSHVATTMTNDCNEQQAKKKRKHKSKSKPTATIVGDSKDQNERALKKNTNAKTKLLLSTTITADTSEHCDSVILYSDADAEESAVLSPPKKLSSIWLVGELSEQLEIVLGGSMVEQSNPGGNNWSLLSCCSATTPRSRSLHWSCAVQPQFWTTSISMGQSGQTWDPASAISDVVGRGSGSVVMNRRRYFQSQIESEQYTLMNVLLSYDEGATVAEFLRPLLKLAGYPTSFLCGKPIPTPSYGDLVIRLTHRGVKHDIVVKYRLEPQTTVTVTTHL